MKQFVNNIAISRKIPALVVVCVVLAMSVISAFFFVKMKDSLLREEEDKILVIRDVRKIQLEDYLNAISTDLLTLANSPYLLTALESFIGAWNARDLGSDPTAALQGLYIADNPYEIGKKENLDHARDTSAYSEIHAVFHPWLRTFRQKKSYYDIFLLDTEGHLVYTVFKESDFATNLKTGAWKDSGLGRAYRAALARGEEGKISFSDFESYGPSKNAPAGFIATPVIDKNGALKGVLAFQMPIDKIDRIMQISSGMGETGETYIVGPDYTMRSSSRLSSESTILKTRVETQAVREALQGKSGKMHIPGYRGVKVFSAYTPVEFEGVRWAVIAEVDMDEAMKPVAQMSRTLLTVALFLMACASLAGVFFARLIVKPITEITSVVNALSSGDTSVEIPALQRRDEVGAIAKALEVFKRNKIEADALARKIKKAYEDVQKAYDDLRNAERESHTKSEFLANMSHELRTPLNSIVGLVQIIRKEDLDADLQESFSLISESARNLLDIVNDILDLSKIEAGEVRLENRRFDVMEKIRHTVQSIAPMAKAKGLLLSYAEKETSLPVLGDELRVSRILSNLLSNAVRYTEKGRIDVTVDITRLPDGKALLRCTVKDTGIGIPAHKIGEVFEKFTQADTSITRKYGGTGLGLTITKELVELMNGKIGVESEEGKGSSFWFELPFQTARSPERAEEKDFFAAQADTFGGTVPAQEAQILLAEDHPMNQILMKKLFKSIGIEHYDIAADGKEALSFLKNRDYDLILMDCHMPEMNGYDATAAIRALPDPRKNVTPIVAMTANAMPEDEQKCLRIGMSDYISKPVNLPVFKKKLSAWIRFDDHGAQEARDKTGTEESAVDLEHLRDMSLDDDAFIKEMAGLFVRQWEEKFETLKGLREGDETERWAETAHFLKGTAGNIGAMPLRALCGKAQAMAGAPAEEKQSLLALIEAEYERARDCLAREKLLDP